MAPMEGLTGYIFRNHFEQHFGKGRVDKYFIPFISPNQTNGYTAREREDIAPEHNRGVYAVPQIMANDSRRFLEAAEMLVKMGYQEVNLNLGCPSGTVVSKHRGAGFLGVPHKLKQFLEEVFAAPIANETAISVKTRLGVSDAEEFPELLAIYNRYPIKEVIVHPRVQKDFYNQAPDRQAFREALLQSSHPVCYNGDLFTAADYQNLTQAFPAAQYHQMEAVMLGRGLVRNPLLLQEILGVQDEQNPKQQIADFVAALFADYQRALSEENNAMHKMKEVWIYLAQSFTGGEKALKRIKKAQRVCDYKAAVQEFFYEARWKDTE